MGEKMEALFYTTALHWLYCGLIFLTVVASGWTTALHSDVTKTDTCCAWEAFNASCSPTQVVLIHKANYGLMNIGKCIKKDYGAVGCKTDVTSFMDAKCSGRRSCHVPVISLHGKSHCNSDFGLYLEITYGCIEASLSPQTSCPPEGHVTVTKSSGQLASAVVASTTTLAPDSVGGPGCPIRIKVPPYQRINVTLIDFTVALSNDGWYPVPGGYRPLQTSCVAGAAGYIVENNGTPASRNISLCAGASATGSGGVGHMRTKQTNVFLSQGNIIDVTIVDSTTPFMVVYSALGCAPIEAPPNAVVQMKGNIAVVECNNTLASWHLTCSGSQWVGSYSNCTTAGIVVADDTHVNDWGMNTFLSNMTTFPYGLLVVISLGVAIGVAIGVLMLLIVLAYLRRRKQRKIRSRSGYALKAVESKYEEGLYHHGLLMAERAQTLGREDHYRCHPVGAECPHVEASTLQLRGVHRVQNNVVDGVIITSPLPNPPVMSPPPIPSLPEGHYSGSIDSGSTDKQHKTMDYRWDSLSMNENEINELTMLRKHPAKSEPKKAFSISYGRKGSGKGKTKNGGATTTRRPAEQPYYFKFDGVTQGGKVDKEEQRPDVVSGCSACQYTPEQSS